MAYEVTATRRRPQQFESLAGQEFVVSTLKNAIEQGRIAHAYLFSGPRGVGKTTSARLLAKALNCVHGPTATPCGECDNCKGIAKGSNLDVIEIDGASNTGVNDVRAIKEEVLFPPTSSRYKIYIIDEVHMLSQSAFNALLKTIEEPPEYVVFIFATTETQKVPATIRSRCQQFNFQLIPLETIEKLLGEAAQEMGVKANKDALFWIAKESTGSMRDAYTLFDQVVAFSNGEITLEKIREKLGIAGLERINLIVEDLLARKQDEAISKINNLLSKGVSTEQIIKDFTDYFRTLLLLKEGIKSENILGERPEIFSSQVRTSYNEEQLEAALELFLNLYRDIRYSLNPRLELELAVSKLSHLQYVSSNATVLEQLARLKNDLIAGTITPLNPLLADQKTIEPLAEKKSQTEPIEPTEPVEPISKNEPSSSTNQEVSIESIKDLLPQGFINIKKENDSLNLEFNNKLCYQLALRSLQKTKTDIKERTGQQINIVPFFSETNAIQEEQKPQELQLCQEPQQHIEQHAEKPKEPVIEQVQNPQEIKTLSALEEERKNLINDLILAFDGKEEK